MVNQNQLDSSLDKLCEETSNKIEDSIKSIKDTIIQQLVDANKNLQAKVFSLEKKVQQLEIDHQASNQYNRQTNILISGIPPEVDHEDLEQISINILNKCNAPVVLNERDFQACHRLSEKNNDVVCRLVNKKDVEKALTNRVKLSKLSNQDKVDLKLPISTDKIYLNVHLTPYNAKLAFYCRRLKKNGFITKMSTNKGIIKILGHFSGPTLNVTWKHISHLDDLIDLFPDLEENIHSQKDGGKD